MHSLDGSIDLGIPEPDPPTLAGALRRIDRGEISALTDVEILAVLLAPGRRDERLERARVLLGTAGLREFGRGEVLARNAGLSAAERHRIRAALELCRRLVPEEGPGRPPVRGPRDVFEVTADLRPLRREHFVGLYLNTRNRLVARETISVGSLNASIVHPREVFEPALRQGAASLIVVHNHPSGETDPSEDDLAITRRLTEAGEILGIPLVDHVIVGAFGFTSLKETTEF